MIHAFVFDLDGTLAETERLKALSYAAAARELRPDLTDEQVVDAFREFVGQTRDDMARNLTTRLGLDEAARARMAEFGVTQPWQVLSAMRVRRYQAMLAEPEILRRERYPHNIDLLHWARDQGYRTALCSMSHRDEVQKVLAALDLSECFDTIASVDDVAHPKPDPEIDLLVARRLGLAPAECLVIEDSPPGVGAAIAAGMPAIAVTTQLTREKFRDGALLDRRWVVDDPTRLMAVVRERLEAAAA
ncbi:MAG TPA: HAD family phosphatase [bacterium]|nr:HAD family phosphatase [bacterium]